MLGFFVEKQIFEKKRDFKAIWGIVLGLVTSLKSFTEQPYIIVLVKCVFNHSLTSLMLISLKKWVIKNIIYSKKNMHGYPIKLLDDMTSYQTDNAVVMPRITQRLKKIKGT